MRYVGLVFLGLVLWAGKASAEFFIFDDAMKIIVKGETISELYYGIGEDAVRYSRVIYKNKLYICSDYQDMNTVFYRCYVGN